MTRTNICRTKALKFQMKYQISGSPGRLQVIIWTNAGIFLIGPLLETNFSEILNLNSDIFIQENAFGNVVWKMAAICLSLSVLRRRCFGVILISVV